MCTYFEDNFGRYTHFINLVLGESYTKVVEYFSLSKLGIHNTGRDLTHKVLEDKFAACSRASQK